MDAVLAIAITLPVVELHAPKKADGNLAAAYLKLARIMRPTALA